jgi:hypothetical protein
MDAKSADLVDKSTRDVDLTLRLTLTFTEMLALREFKDITPGAPRELTPVMLTPDPRFKEPDPDDMA